MSSKGQAASLMWITGARQAGDSLRGEVDSQCERFMSKWDYVV